MSQFDFLEGARCLCAFNVNVDGCMANLQQTVRVLEIELPMVRMVPMHGELHLGYAFWVNIHHVSWIRPDFAHVENRQPQESPHA